MTEDGESIHVMANPRAQTSSQNTTSAPTNTNPTTEAGPTLTNNATNQPPNAGNILNQLLGGLGGIPGETQVVSTFNNIFTILL